MRLRGSHGKITNLEPCFATVELLMAYSSTPQTHSRHAASDIHD